MWQNQIAQNINMNFVTSRLTWPCPWLPSLPSVSPQSPSLAVFSSPLAPPASSVSPGNQPPQLLVSRGQSSLLPHAL